MSRLGSKSEQRPNGNHEPQGEVASRNSRPVDVREEFVPHRASFHHPEWILDRATSGTAPESTRIAMGRQFARTLGTLLARNTSSSSESVEVLEQALSSRSKVVGSERYLYAAIDTVSQSYGYDRATRNMVRLMDQALEGVSFSEKLSVTAGLMRQTVVKMFSEMLDAPSIPGSLMSMSGDESMCTVFGLRGEVEKMSVTMLRGHLSSAFKETLREAHQKYQEKKAALQEGGVIKVDEVFELKLTIEGDASVFKTTKEDLIESYTAALMRYASIKYADRMRKLEGKGIE